MEYFGQPARTLRRRWRSHCRTSDQGYFPSFFMFFKLLKRPKIEDRGTFFGFTTSNVVALRVCFYPPCTTYVLPLMRIEMVFSIPFWCRKISTETAFEFQMWHSWWFPSLCEFVLLESKSKARAEKTLLSSYKRVSFFLLFCFSLPRQHWRQVCLL